MREGQKEEENLRSARSIMQDYLLSASFFRISRSTDLWDFTIKNSFRFPATLRNVYPMFRRWIARVVVPVRTVRCVLKARSSSRTMRSRSLQRSATLYRWTVSVLKLLCVLTVASVVITLLFVLDFNQATFNSRQHFELWQVGKIMKFTNFLLEHDVTWS